MTEVGPLVISLEGKTALVTGGSRGIGRAIALQYAHCGADVCIIYNKSDKDAASAVEEITRIGVKGLAIKCEASDTEESSAAVTQTIETLGRLDILVNNVATLDSTPFLSLDASTWKRSVTVNIDSLYNFTFPAVHHMRERRSGHILNVGSICGVRPITAVPVHYAATKGAMNAFTFTLAKEVGRYDIFVNSIAPGLIDTDFSQVLPGNRRDDFSRFCPLGRIGTPQEVARLSAFIVSDLNSYMTGETVIVGGGL